ncbi:MAG: carbohydrate ABC transporter permease [Chloroflexales bacterium]|nr:carbohydrate ABC transporter permease [Chloroflexales bacterium]
MSRERVELGIIQVLRVVGIVFFAVIAIFPFYWMVVLSFRPLANLLREPARLVPNWEEIRTLEPYRGVLFEQGFGRFVLNSTVISIATTILTLVLAVMGAYAIARLRFRGRRLMSSGVLLIYMFPAIVLAIPLFVAFSSLGLRGSLVVLVIVYLAQTLPVALYMLRSYFQTVPYDLEEAGLIDGCNRFEVIWRITLPLSMPALASVALYTFMIAWNEFLFALLFLVDSPDRWTLSLGVQQLDNFEVPKTWLMAGAVITTVPIIVIFFFFERFLTRGLTAGAVKG